MGFGNFLKTLDPGGVVGDTWNWLSSNKGDQNADADRNFLNPYMQQGSPFLQGQSPQQGNYNSLIQMLQQRASGQGPSVAADQYRQATDDNMNRALMLGAGSNAGAARQAALNAGNIQQGLTTGMTAARNQEMMGATGQLGNAIGGADQSQLLRDKANQEAWLQMLMQKFGLTKAQEGPAKSNIDLLGGTMKGVGQAAAMMG